MTLKPSAGDVSELEWTKSSYSGQGNGNECLEVAWQKSSYSGDSDSNECLEVAPTPSTIHIRDSKNPHGPQLHLRPSAWADFVAYAVAQG
ncbi:DUF397 domain-containing protein [Streptomyces sp. Je 1-4]|uniref:DUF397 domain-containing protein n=1 Tax=Streptomyces TaxID=1883 RepID=UPI0021D96868|nr:MULTISPECIES: DUF397 domain-containing protein [unclassified Streptomyces]UYB41163.1 DUF397 domain-containing protein [Streptomyces sp. Je 1-4]UZQ37338.1 DUF397 domain-containing protein [Streptomyces sp. Je 1-4] [Streptomyces sp. Je 1-4 4N24]UZQ44755.1 DUF397 domain-containing protein [Streptomyces sp. Je 1-4] [Streptomyces sp. Je 1-4 4N24_ara]